MTLTPRLAIALAGIGVFGAGAVLWAKFGGLVYFDTIASAFIGCLI